MSKQPRCLAERIRPENRAGHWHIETGTVRLWIVGPGPDAMHPASATYYSGRIGSAEERAIAQRACQILDRDHWDTDAGEAEIAAALTEARQQIERGLPMPTAPAMITLPPRAPKPPPVIATPEQIARIAATVARVTGVEVQRIRHCGRGGRCDWPRIHARCIAYQITYLTYPDMSHRQIAEAFHRDRSNLSNALSRHPEYLKQPTYAAHFKTALFALS